MSGSDKSERQHPAFYILLVVLTIMSVGPIVLMLITSLRLNVDIMSDTSRLIFVPTLRNYEAVLCNVLWYRPQGLDACDPTFSRALGNSLFIATIATFITLVLGCMAAYAIVRFRFFGRDGLSLVTLMTRMVPPAVLLVPVFAIDTYQAIWGANPLHPGNRVEPLGWGINRRQPLNRKIP